MYGRTDGRSCDYYVTTKISWLDRLPNFLSNGALLIRNTVNNGNYTKWKEYKIHYGKEVVGRPKTTCTRALK